MINQIITKCLLDSTTQPLKNSINLKTSINIFTSAVDLSGQGTIRGLDCLPLIAKATPVFSTLID